MLSTVPVLERLGGCLGGGGAARPATTEHRAGATTQMLREFRARNRATVANIGLLQEKLLIPVSMVTPPTPTQEGRPAREDAHSRALVRAMLVLVTRYVNVM